MRQKKKLVFCSRATGWFDLDVRCKFPFILPLNQTPPPSLPNRYTVDLSFPFSSRPFFPSCIANSQALSLVLSIPDSVESVAVEMGNELLSILFFEIE